MWNAVCKLCKVHQQHHEILEQEDFLVGISTLKGPWETQRRQDVQPCGAPWERGQPARDTTRLPFPGPARGEGAPIMTGDIRQKAGPSGRLAPGRLVMTPGPASTRALFSSTILRRNCGDIGRPPLHPTARPSGTTVWTLTFIGPAVMGHGEAPRPSSTGFPL